MTSITVPQDSVSSSVAVIVILAGAAGGGENRRVLICARGRGWWAALAAPSWVVPVAPAVSGTEHGLSHKASSSVGCAGRCSRMWQSKQTRLISCGSGREAGMVGSRQGRQQARQQAELGRLGSVNWEEEVRSRLGSAGVCCWWSQQACI